MSLRLYGFTCGWLSASLGAFLEGEEGEIRVPVPSFLVEHPKGRLLFDTGLHPDTQTDPAARLGHAVAAAYRVEFRPGEEIAGRLAALDLGPDDVDWVVNSHLHFDHTGGNTLLPDARLLVQRREWEAGQDPDLRAANFFQLEDYDHGHDVLRVDGEHDVFGDGSVVCVPTYGHTPGHQSLRITLGSGTVLLAADSCYLRRTLEQLHLPPVVFDPAAMRETLGRLRELQARGTRIFFGHDPEFWSSVPQAPNAIG
jgi:glyoxylase-like metal-dependent hydrolase (beta-lactamase superfamily II)